MAKMIFSRRTILVATGALATMAAVGVANSRAGYIATILQQKLSYLQFAPGSIEEFAGAMVESDPTMDTMRGHVVSYLGVALSQSLALWAPGKFATQLDAFEERVAALFLLSSDFFPNGMDTASPVSFVALADPYANACYNVLAVID